MIDDSQLVATLLEEGLADQATVDEGLQRTEQSGQSLYETLITTKLVAEPELVEVVSRILDVPTSTVDAHKIPADVSALVPGSMARRNRVLPLGRGDGGELLLGMANPVDALAMDEIAMHAGLEIRPVLVGPAALSDALSALYPTADVSQEVADAVLDAFDDDEFDVDDLMDDVMPGDEWSDYFDDASEASVEDSAVLSRDMQDRPSTDVLAEEDVDAALEEVDEEDLPEIEIIEELGQPIRRRPPSPYASLDEWEVDEAIAGESEIINANSAAELFAPGKGDAAIEEEEEEADETSQLSVDISESHTDALETSNKTSVGVGVDHLREGAEGEGAGKALPKKKKRLTVENTGKTELGLPRDESAKSDVLTEAHAPDDLADDEEWEEEDEDLENTDYGALGRAILKSGPSGKRRRRRKTRPKDGEEELPADSIDGDDATDIADDDDERRPTNPRPIENPESLEPAEKKANTSIVVALFEDDEEFDDQLAPPSNPTHARGLSEARLSEAHLSEAHVSEAQLSEAEVAPTSDPHISEAEVSEPHVSEPHISEAHASEPDDLDDLDADDATGIQPDAGTRPRLASPALTLPEGIDAHGLALALANILVRKGICTIDEIFELATFLSKKE